MLILFRTCLILSLLILSPSELLAQETKEQKIVKLIELTNGQDMAEQMIQALMPIMRQQLKGAAHK